MIYISQWKKPITTDMLHSFANILLPSATKNNITVLSCILVGFFSFFRSSNLLPKSPNKFNPLCQLSRDSFRFYSWGIILSVLCTKNHQSPDEPLWILMPTIPGSPICPILLLQQNFHNFKDYPSDSPAFLVRPSLIVPSLTSAELCTAIKHLVTIIGLNPKFFSNHSLCRGGATFIFSSGLPSELIKLQGD